MACAVLSSLSQTIDQVLNHDEYPNISNVGKEEIKSLLEQVDLLQDFLKKYPDEASRFEARMREAANEAEDVIEHFMYEETRWRHRSNRWAAAGRAAAPADILNDFDELKMITEEMKSINRETAPIIKEIERLSLRPRQTRPQPQPQPQPAPMVDAVTVGLDEGFEKIKGLVCGESSQREIIPITGMGGIGKSTLANKVYHDATVVEKFPVRAWVNVTQDHKPQNIFEDLRFSLLNVVNKGSFVCSDSVQDDLYKMLIVRKYLIVLDDVWSQKAWDDIRKVFPDVGNGSRIMLTTRDESVASLINPGDAHHKMQLLKKEQSWDLLNQKVQCPDNLKKIGKDIATSCGGLPLAIVLVAGILSNVGKNVDSWDEIAQHVAAAVDEKDGEFEKLISLSYTHLPLHLRPCFLYMAGFPRDYEIRLSKLIKLWIAEGFVEDEAEAEQHLTNLLSRSLASVTGIKSNGKVKSCNVHDLVRDLCKRKALEEDYDRRLSIAHPDIMQLARAYASTLRSVLSFQPSESSLVGLRKFRLMRVLDVVDTEAYSLPAPVFDLFHLRYLAFGCPMEVPAAISRLQKLHTLVIRPINRLRNHTADEVYLPSEIWTLPLLTHLVSFFDLLPDPETYDASALENLLTLSVVKKLICTKEMMKMISSVKKLAITYFGDTYQEDYQLQNLHLLHHLEKLTLVAKKGSLIKDHLKANPVFPKTLRKLTLSGWRFPWEYMGIIGSLPELQVLKLLDHSFEGGTWETKEDQFPKLEFLHIDESDLEAWVIEVKDFPKLKRLMLHRCGNLSEIPEDIGNIPTLKFVEVDHTNESLVECVKKIEKGKKEDGNEILQFRFVHNKGY